MPHVRSPSLRMFTELLSDPVPSALTADPVPPGAQVVRASSLDRVSLWIARAEQVWMWVSAGSAR